MNLECFEFRSRETAQLALKALVTLARGPELDPLYPLRKPVILEVLGK